jgi:glycosyltransferase involved in cell wall biosynthesis
LDQLVKAVGHLKANCSLELVLIGDGPEKATLVDLVRQCSLQRVRFLSPMSHHEIPSTLASADILVVPLVGRIRGAVPSKLYEAMASGKPVILVAEGEAASLVNETEAGLVVRPGDRLGLIAALESLAADPELRTQLGANGRKAAVRRFDRRRIMEDFVTFLEWEMRKAITEAA